MEALFLELLNRSIAAGWMILAVILLRLALKKAPKWVDCALWALVGVRLIVPFCVQSGFSLVPSAQTLPPEMLYAAAPAIDSGIDALNQAVNPAMTSFFAPSPAASANPLQIWAFAASVVWAAGMAVLLLYTLLSYVRLRRRVQTAVRLRDGVFESENVASPFVLGLFQPRIYLPAGMAQDDLSHVVAHEQAHIRRRDHWIKLIGFLLLTVYWFNPLVWLAYILLCRDIELACDERVIRVLGAEERRSYSAALLRLSAGRSAIAACPLAFGETGVKRRIQSVLRYKKPALWIIAAAAVACAALAVCFLTNPKDALSNAALLEEAYPLAQSCAMVNGMAIERADARLERSPGAVAVDFPVNGGASFIRVSFVLADNAVYSAQVALWPPEETPLPQAAAADAPKSAAIGTFVSETCIYMNPLSSFIALDGDSGLAYTAGAEHFIMMNRSSGEVTAAISPIRWDWTPMDGALWNALFPMEFGTPDISAYAKPHMLRLSDQYYLFNMDGALWIGDYRDDPVGMWSVFSLTPTTDAAVADAAAKSAEAPLSNTAQ